MLAFPPLQPGLTLYGCNVVNGGQLLAGRLQIEDTGAGQDEEDGPGDNVISGL